MAWTTPRTWIPGEIVTADLMNVQVRDNQLQLRADIDALGVGWTDVAFDAANFWPGITAGMVPQNRYVIIGKTMFWTVMVAAAPAPNPASVGLTFRIPAGLGASYCLMGPAITHNPGVGWVDAWITAGAAGWINIYLNAGGNWGTSAANCYAYFTAIIHIT